jgi:hypothetical protein
MNAIDCAIPLYHDAPDADGKCRVYDKQGRWIAECVSVDLAETMCRNLNHYYLSSEEEKIERIYDEVRQIEERIRDIKRGRLQEHF